MENTDEPPPGWASKVSFLGPVTFDENPFRTRAPKKLVALEPVTVRLEYDDLIGPRYLDKMLTDRARHQVQGVLEQVLSRSVRTR